VGPGPALARIHSRLRAELIRSEGKEIRCVNLTWDLPTSEPTRQTIAGIGSSASDDTRPFNFPADSSTTTGIDSSASDDTGPSASAQRSLSQCSQRLKERGGADTFGSGQAS
jgi:hypothetical protein